MKAGIPEGMPSVTTPLAPAMRRRDDVGRHHRETTSRSRATRSATPDELATIIYTSGRTGVPKGVMHSFRTMCAATMFARDRRASRADDRMLSYLPLAHAIERAAVEIPSMKVGMHVFFAESLDTFVEDLQRARPTIFVSVPRLWSKFQHGVFAKMPPKKLAAPALDPDREQLVRKKILGGLGLDEVRYAASRLGADPGGAARAWYASLGLELLEGYGMTENFAISHGDAAGRGAHRLRRPPARRRRAAHHRRRRGAA